MQHLISGRSSLIPLSPRAGSEMTGKVQHWAERNNDVSSEKPESKQQ